MQTVPYFIPFIDTNNFKLTKNFDKKTSQIDKNANGLGEYLSRSQLKNAQDALMFGKNTQGSHVPAM